MNISAIVRNGPMRHEAVVRTDARMQAVAIAPKVEGKGSAVNGGELLMLALATCYCNDLYREAERRTIQLESVEVEASARFPGVGLAATDIRYRASVRSSAPPSAIEELLCATDVVSEVHNTIRAGARVILETDPA